MQMRPVGADLLTFATLPGTTLSDAVTGLEARTTRVSKAGRKPPET